MILVFRQGTPQSRDAAASGGCSAPARAHIPQFFSAGVVREYSPSPGVHEYIYGKRLEIPGGRGCSAMSFGAGSPGGQHGEAGPAPERSTLPF